MCLSTGLGLDPEVAIFLTVLLGCSMVFCLVANARLVWLGAKGSPGSDRVLTLSPYLLSCSCSDTAITCIFGPVLCILLTEGRWLVNDVLCAFLDSLFLALFWSSVISLLLYNLDRHCLIVQRRMYLDAFGKQRRNTINLVVTWITSAVSSLPYLHARSSQRTPHTPMTFYLRKNMLYCVFALLVLYVTPMLIILTSLIKTLLYVKIKPRQFHSNEGESGHINARGVLREDFQTHKGLMASSCVFILTSLPWVAFQFLKALELIGNSSTAQEIALVVFLVIGIGFKTIIYVLCCGFVRKRFFANLFQTNSCDFTLEPSPVVLFNNRAH